MSTDNSAPEEFLVDPTLHSTEAIMRAAHRFTATHFVEIRRTGDGIAVIATTKTASATHQRIREEFQAALLDETLRERIAEESRGVRDLLVATAFARALPRSDSSGSKA